MKNLYTDCDLVKEIKKKKRWAIFLPLVIMSSFVAQSILFVVNILNNFDISYLVCVLGTFVTMSCAKDNNEREKEREFISNIVSDINRKRNKENNLYLNKLSDIEIIPKNIQIGEDLSSKNIVPIFKEGHYIIMGSLPNLCVMRQIKEDDKMVVDIYDSEEEEEILLELEKTHPKLMKRLKNEEI